MPKLGKLRDKETIGRPPFEQLLKLEGQEKGLYILKRFISYNEDIKDKHDLLLYAMACGRYLTKWVETPHGDGKFTEALPFKADSREMLRLRKRYFDAARRIGIYFSPLKLTAEQSKCFIDEVSGLFFDLYLGKSFNESVMLRDEYIAGMIMKYGFAQFIEALRAALKNRPVNLQTEISILIREKPA